VRKKESSKQGKTTRPNKGPTQKLTVKRPLTWFSKREEGVTKVCYENLTPSYEEDGGGKEGKIP